jgi:TetR/AcrR family transcriptional repressor of nem operon
MRDYLSAPHRDIRGDGCVFASLGADVARHEGPVREAFTEGLRSFINFVTKLIPGRSHTSRRRQAISTLSEMVGALVLARAVGDAELSDEILAASAARRSA